MPLMGDVKKIEYIVYGTGFDGEERELAPQSGN